MTTKLSKMASKYANNTCKHEGIDDYEVKKLIQQIFIDGYNAANDEFKSKKKDNFPSDKLIDDMRCLLGIPSHDHWGNISMGDGYFAKDLRSRIANAGCNWEEVQEEAKRLGRLLKPSWDI